MYLPWDAGAPVTGALVSVVTPTYRRVDLLKQCVTSVLAQGYPRIEHVVVGDGCPDLDAARDELLGLDPALRITNLDRSEPVPAYAPSRIARVRNAGVRLATGSLVAHLDDDNAWEPDHVESLVEALAGRPDAALALSHRQLLVEGVQPYTWPCHPWSADVETGRRVWREYERMGVYRPGDPVMRDRISFSEERDVTADTNQMLVRREIHELFPFTVWFPEPMREKGYGEDDVFSEQVHRAGHRVVCSGRATLRFRIGGRFTATALAVAAPGTMPPGGTG